MDDRGSSDLVVRFWLSLRMRMDNFARSDQVDCRIKDWITGRIEGNAKSPCWNLDKA